MNKNGIFLVILLSSINSFLSAQNTSINCIEPIANTDLSKLNWDIDPLYDLIIYDDHKCDSNYAYNRSGEIVLQLKNKSNDSILSTYYLQVIHQGEVDMSIIDFGIIEMGPNKPSVILVKEVYLRLIDNINEVTLYKLECINGNIVENKIY